MLFLPAIKKIDFLNPDALRLEYFIPFGIFLFNVHFVIIKGHKYDPNTEKALEQVRKAEKEKLITKNEAKIQYTNIIRSHVRSYDVEKNNFSDKKA
jgi:hypothetical protein